MPPVATRQSQPPRAKSTAQLVAETLVDIIAIVIVGMLAMTSKIDGNVAVAVCAALAGVRLTDIIGSRNGGSGTGGMAGLVVGLGSMLFHRGTA